MGESGKLIKFMICCWMMYWTVGMIHSSQGLCSRSQIKPSSDLSPKLLMECVAWSHWSFPHLLGIAILTPCCTLLPRSKETTKQFQMYYSTWLPWRPILKQGWILVLRIFERALELGSEEISPNYSQVINYHYDHSYPINGHNLLPIYTWFQLQKL